MSMENGKERNEGKRIYLNVEEMKIRAVLHFPGAFRSKFGRERETRRRRRKSEKLRGEKR